ncbi:PilN domain-containing protein [Pseudomonas sichuanensis]|uniref:PilN domain-containing protein n=1 Tax=Pseudomonas sichuanensis TaxID=2213015 RepID=UPI0024478532|nr:PilN domain-containing protein [Pseudomonas sichuanensis]MDH0730849.1 PilN domain-containing protein [Pseudomonas sichuanensis]MDH1582026.1 PilN domain-containing protein [Pseudomonas sichuanensis]MDH1594573.1 PilN domain-containing protein [Pseudomonas sichuanensis]MDH1596601.1 PilN domain-containing protein [Pseudomonas sichuanensis]
MLYLNLMPWRERRRARDAYRFRMLVIAGLVLALLGVMLLDHLARSRLARQIDAVTAQQAQVQRIDAIVAQVEQLREARDALLAEQAQLLGLRARQATLPGFFLGLEHALPEGARLTELKALDGQFRLTGQAASPAVVARFMRDLQAAQVLQDLQLVHLRNLETGDEFVLTARLAAHGS